MLASSHGDELLSELAERLESRYAATRRVAVRALGELDSLAAWELVLPHLGDPEGEVADEAQWQLARMQEVSPLLGRSGLRASDPWVRLRAAESIGRSHGPIDGRALSRHLSRSEPDVTAALVWSIERLARRGVLEDEEGRCARDVARAVRYGGHAGAAALLCLESLGASELEVELVRAAERGDALLRAAAAEASARRDGIEDWERVKALSKDEDAGVRRVLVDALALRPDRRRAHLLVERLGEEEVVTVRDRVLQQLRAWSGLMHRYDPRPWRDWARSLSEEWQPGVPVELGSSLSGTADSAEISVRSNRLSVLVDFSGSIWTEMPDEATRRDFVELELERLLRDLPLSAHFNVIAFSDEPHPWKGELVPNRRGCAAEAMKWYRRLRVRGRGDLFAAAELALDDPDVDTLLVFTDGVPTGGRRWKLELMALLLQQECRFRGVSIDSVLVGASKRTVKAWDEIAGRTGGRSISLNLGSEGREE